MQPYPAWRPVVVLALISLICLPVASPTAGQDVRSASEFASALPDDFFYLGAPLGSETDGKEPMVAPAVPKKPGPSDTEAAAPPRRPTPPAREPARRTDMTSMLAARGPIMRLASMPNMFGDSYGYQLQVADVAGIQTVDIPPPGGTRRFKISENDKALPMNRVFFTYNHFQDAVEASIVDLGVESYPIDQYTIGLEKTFRDDLWSVELRLPFGRTPHVTGRKLEVDTADVGNLSITVKRLLFATPTTILGIGLPIGTPTGGDVTGEGAVSSYSLSNDAVHLAPFVGFANAPNDRVFSEGFLQVDVPTNGNRVCFGGSQLGKLTEQTLLYLDLALGYWVYRNPYAHYVSGLAAMVEYHYTTTLEDAQIVSGTDGSQVLQFGNTLNRMDISNLTIGLHTELGKTTVRVGGAFPLSGGPNRLYDAEVHVSVNRRF